MAKKISPDDPGFRKGGRNEAQNGSSPGSLGEEFSERVVERVRGATPPDMGAQSDDRRRRSNSYGEEGGASTSIDGGDFQAAVDDTCEIRDNWSIYLNALPYPACIVEAKTFVVKAVNSGARDYWAEGQPCSQALLCRRIINPDNLVLCPAQEVLKSGRNLVIDYPVPLHAYPLYLNGEEVSHILLILLNSGLARESFAFQTIDEMSGSIPRMGLLEPFLDAMAMGITITNREGKILFTNAAEARMHGYERRELIGQHARIFATEKMWNGIPLEELVHRGIWDRESVNVTRDGRKFPVRLVSMPLTDVGGNPLGIITLSQDMSRTRRVEEVLEEVRHEAALGRMAAMVAHQVNNPLAAMKARVALLRQDIEDVESVEETIAILCGQVDRIAETMKSLLDFAGQQRCKPREDVNLNTAVDGVLQLFQNILNLKGIAVEVDLPDDLPPLMGAMDDIQEIFINLLENARQALTRGSHIQLHCRIKGRWVEVTCEDDGPGLGDDPEKVFEPFFTTKASGTGLGLTIARRICRDHGGYMMAENRSPDEGGGARFTLSLPIAEEERDG